MFKKFITKNHSKDEIDEKIEIVKKELKDCSTDDQTNFERLSDELNMLFTLKENQKSDKGFKVSGDTIVNGFIGLASILLILNYEKTDVITSKGMQIAGKLIGKK